MATRARSIPGSLNQQPVGRQSPVHVWRPLEAHADSQDTLCCVDGLILWAAQDGDSLSLHFGKQHHCVANDEGQHVLLKIMLHQQWGGALQLC